MEMNQCFQSGDRERQKGTGRKGCTMGAVENEKELGYFHRCTVPYYSVFSSPDSILLH